MQMADRTVVPLIIKSSITCLTSHYIKLFVTQFTVVSVITVMAYMTMTYTITVFIAFCRTRTAA